MQAFVVNLAKDVERRQYVNSVLSPYIDINFQFIPAVDGRLFTENQRDKYFDNKKFEKQFYRSALDGEIGCALSHQIIYKKIIEEKLSSALVFEDDIIIKEDLSPILPLIEKCLDTNAPTIILLSGWFWYTKKHYFDKSHYRAKVIDGYLTHSYAINYAAAKMISNDYPSLLADAWEKYIKKGVHIWGIVPHLIDQDWSNFISTISTDKRNSVSRNPLYWCKIKKRTIIQRALKLIGCFEEKSINETKEIENRTYKTSHICDF